MSRSKFLRKTIVGWEKRGGGGCIFANLLLFYYFLSLLFLAERRPNEAPAHLRRSPDPETVQRPRARQDHRPPRPPSGRLHHAAPETGRQIPTQVHHGPASQRDGSRRPGGQTLPSHQVLHNARQTQR